MKLKRTSVDPTSMVGYEDVSHSKRSEVWKHFLLNKVLDDAKCVYCSVKLSPVTSTLGRHLKIKHNIVVKSITS